ncbi:DNA mismatch repair endonuclease MutL [bacterium]|nr:DNA mismatch repair endonuclease MutL [bacterium]
MNPKIKKLPEILMKRIAAGEVVERPASVVKELLENALDAGATAVRLWIADGGMELIRVADDGEGMTEQDAGLCCERHATSKITSPEDLEAIQTFGFRGEALASIGSVARMEIVTRTEEDPEATRIHIEDGRVTSVEKTAGTRGTLVSVRNLFYNVPARKKFQKSPGNEFRHCVLAFKRMALSHPAVRFTLFVQDEKTMDLAPGTEEERVRSLLGDARSHHLVSFNRESGTLKCRGFVSRPGEARRTRDDQYLFVNRRYIQSRNLMHAVLSAYGPRLDKSEYPFYVLFLETDPRDVDVNVHPTKIEVRFSDERFIHDLVYRGIRDALKSPPAVPQLFLVPGGKRLNVPPPVSRNEPPDGQLSLEVQRPLFNIDTTIYPAAEPTAPVFWQVHNRYILSQIKSGLTLIDQHAAHERILFEKALAARKGPAHSQQMLFPQTVRVEPEDFAVLTEILPYLERIGFSVKDFGNGALVIEAVPVDVKTGMERELLQDILDEYKETRKEFSDIWESVAAAYACRSAIKSGDKLTLMEMASLVDQLFAADEPYFCPHGRPVVVTVNLEELDRRFGR